MKKYFWMIFAFNAASPAMACMHFPAGTQLRDISQEVFLFHDGSQAHMVVSTSFYSDKLPREVAWVLPLPKVPTQYTEIKGPFFEELSRLLPGDRTGLSKGRGLEADGRKGGSSGLKLHEKVVTDSYEVQPIEILSENAGSELNQWLKKMKYNPMPVNLQKPYLKKGAAFLAIRMQLKNPVQGTLRSAPLHIVYPSDQLTMPLRLTHANRQFDLSLYVFSKNEIQQDFKSFYLQKMVSAPYQNQRLSPFVDEILGQNKGYVTLYRGEDLNSKSQSLKNLKEDPDFFKSAL